MPNTQNNTGFYSLAAGEALERYRRVKISAGTAVYADAGEDSIGVTQQKKASGDLVPIKLWNAGGTFAIESAGAITADADVYGAADGKIDDTASGDKIGVSREDASGAAEAIEVVLESAESGGAISLASVDDINGNESIILTATASAVNELTVTNAATGNAVGLVTSGGDTNIGLTIGVKGAGDITVTSGDDLLLQPGPLAADVAKIQAYDVAATAYEDLVVASGHATTPTLAINASGGVTVGSAAAGPIAFFGVTPASQVAHIASVATNLASNATADMNTLSVAINAMQVAIETMGFVATA